MPSAAGPLVLHANGGLLPGTFGSKELRLLIRQKCVSSKTRLSPTKGPCEQGSPRFLDKDKAEPRPAHETQGSLHCPQNLHLSVTRGPLHPSGAAE